ncbi:MAG: DUF2268 domain-containing protein [Candidatus Pacearchaeota archaeon]|nr:DUF2268 domain-containing protein [Candidatus Pacearchaeota archaeon]
MEYYKIIIDKKELAEIFIFSGELDLIVREIPFIEEIGYAGYKEKRLLGDSLAYSNVGGDQGKILYENKEEIKEIIKSALNKCKNLYDDKRYVFVFPVSDKFIREKMEGVSGFTVYERTIWIFIDPNKKLDNKAIEGTTIHEMAHTLSKYFGSETYLLGESLIHEGLAENFSESLMHKKEPWAVAVTKGEAKEILREIKDLIKEEDSYKLHGEIFFGTGRYPNWAGYTIGYYLVNDYLNKRFGDGEIDWKDAFNTNSEDVLKTL